MNKLSTAILGTLLTLTFAHAKGMKCGAGKCGSSMNSAKTDSKLLNDTHNTDGYQINISSKKSLINGNNNIEVTLYQDKRQVTDVKVKVKFFMPEMPGMPYMEYKEKLKLNGETYKGVVNFSMNGTWQYHLKFKTADEKVHKVRGSVNL